MPLEITVDARPLEQLTVLDGGLFDPVRFIAAPEGVPCLPGHFTSCGTTPLARLLAKVTSSPTFDALNLAAGGKSFDDPVAAAQLARAEAVERAIGVVAGLRPPDITATEHEMSGRGEPAILPSRLPLYLPEQRADRRFYLDAPDPEAGIGWTETATPDGVGVWVPSQAVWLVGTGTDDVTFLRSSSAGLAYGPNLVFARAAASEELIERDALNRFWYGETGCRPIDATLLSAVVTATLGASFVDAVQAVEIPSALDGTRVAVVWTWIAGRTFPFAVGSAPGPSLNESLARALSELAQTDRAMAALDADDEWAVIARQEILSRPADCFGIKDVLGGAAVTGRLGETWFADRIEQRLAAGWNAPAHRRARMLYVDTDVSDHLPAIAGVVTKAFSPDLTLPCASWCIAADHPALKDLLQADPQRWLEHFPFA